MSVLINIFFVLLVLCVVGILLYFRLTERKSLPDPIDDDKKKYKIPTMVQFVKDVFNEITTANLSDLELSEEEYHRRKNKRADLQRALRGCSTGDINDKLYVKEFIFDLLLKTYGVNNENLNYSISFDHASALSAQDKFDILLHMYKKKYGYQALSTLIEAYDLARPKRVIENGKTESYIITSNEIHDIFKKEYRPLKLEDKLQIVVQRIYQLYLGFSVIDDIRDQVVDGVSGGVSGLPSTFMSQIADDYDLYLDQVGGVPQAHDSVWLFYKGKSIHLSFLSFGSEMELKRVCQNIYTYNNSGQLSETSPYKVNEMKDGSRIVVVRPGFSESWSFFVRKFDVPNATLPQLIKDPNAEFAIWLLEYLVKGCRIIAVTGAQGSGKTTLLMALVREISAIYPLRVQEMAFELHLRKIYPMRNILTFRETENISGQEGLDIQKKTDGTVNILGEVATDPVAAWMIQMAQVASLFTVFTHHAKTLRSLIENLRNALLKVGIFSNEKIAEEQVVSVLNFDIHMRRDNDGKRYIERITECVPLVEDPLPEEFINATDMDTKWSIFMSTVIESKRASDKKCFIENNILEFRNGEYVVGNPISDANREEMLSHMNDQDRQAFGHFLNKYWGPKHEQVS